MTTIKMLLHAIFICLISSLFAHSSFDELLSGNNEIVISTKRIVLEDFPDAYNPTILKTEKGYLLAFRFHPDRERQPCVSFIGVVLLNEAFTPISTPQIVKTRFAGSKTPSQSEDPRLFSYRGRTFLIYNDNVEVPHPNVWHRRDMFIAELLSTNNHYTISTPLKLVYEEKYNSQLWQKNWVPFEWNGSLLLGYSINPHEILYANLFNGSCYKCYETQAPLNWGFGTLRGSTPPQIVDGEHLAFFHTGMSVSSSYSWNEPLWHYFIGAYAFAASPPFEITKMSASPIIGKGFYTLSHHVKRVVFPGGFVVADSKIHLAYGKDDYEIWIATLDKNALMKSLVPVRQ